MIDNPSEALQYAIYQELSKTYNVYDGMKFDGEYPYIVIGEEYRTDDNPKDAKITEHHMVMSAWSLYNGMRDIKRMGSDVIERLTGQLLELPEPYRLVDARLYNVRYLRDDNGATDVSRALMQFKFKIHKQ